MRALILALLLPVPAMADAVTVFAAASLKSALDPIAEIWSAETGHTVTISYGGTATLAKQIIAGAPADMFISASEPWMDDVMAAGVMAEGSRVDLLGNTLVLVGQAGADPVVLADLPAQLGDGKLSMAFVDSVPAGQYGKAALESLGLWAAVAGQVVQSENVRVALAFVARGEAALGVVYASDAVAEPGVAVVATFPEGSHPEIIYPAALTAQAGPAAEAFLAALQAPAADAVFLANGFSLR
ncbi:MAG: molybdate ABC transporter substrate-binding protein [Rhodobacteraceae bacterium]|jgi:molybdate transport system substrate-binding protein|nr:molybdate ABC transporter substrate-binding protein [Paracoccaceae bacterium]